MVQNRVQVTSSAGTANIVRRKSTRNPIRTAVVYAAIEINVAFQKFRRISGHTSKTLRSLSDVIVRFNRAPLWSRHSGNLVRSGRVHRACRRFAADIRGRVTRYATPPELAEIGRLDGVSGNWTVPAMTNTPSPSRRRC